MDQFTTLTHSARATVALGKKCMEESLKKAGQDMPLIFYLTGELGAGKTHFVKGLAEGLGIKDNITSPTFVLMKKYGQFFHIDCYRIHDAEDARQIGLDKIFEIPNAVIAVEWAERIEEIVPLPYWKIEFEHMGKNGRRISVSKIKN